MSIFEYRAKKAKLESDIAAAKLQLYNLLRKIDVTERYAERFADCPCIKDYETSAFTDEERAEIAPLVAKLNKLTDQLFKLTR
jgi:hypothetical protein